MVVHQSMALNKLTIRETLWRSLQSTQRWPSTYVPTAINSPEQTFMSVLRSMGRGLCVHGQCRQRNALRTWLWTILLIPHHTYSSCNRPLQSTPIANTIPSSPENFSTSGTMRHRGEDTLRELHRRRRARYGAQHSLCLGAMTGLTDCGRRIENERRALRPRAAQPTQEDRVLADANGSGTAPVDPRVRVVAFDPRRSASESIDAVPPTQSPIAIECSDSEEHEGTKQLTPPSSSPESFLHASISQPAFPTKDFISPDPLPPPARKEMPFAAIDPKHTSSVPCDQTR